MESKNRLQKSLLIDYLFKIRQLTVEILMEEIGPVFFVK